MEIRIGKVKHYWPHVQAAEVQLEGMNIQVGDKLHIKGHGHDFVQTVKTIQVEHQDRSVGHVGEHVAIAVKQPVHENDDVFLVRESTGKD